MRKTHSNAAEFTVSEISGALRKTIEETYGNVRVRGEISGYRGPHASGHAYFALKDDKARLEAVIWRTAMQSLKFPPEEGLEVIASGRLSSYAGSSKYQIIIDSLEPAGAGALMALLEERRKKLAEEGLFDESRKKPLPFMPKIIGVITSPTGAVIRDIIHRIEDRFPLHIVVWPVRVQGESAGAAAAAAIRGFNALPDSARGLAGGGRAMENTRGLAGGGREREKSTIPRPDLLIIARGGGSLEDLWSFNDEALVRAAAASALPIISAIGHETDWTLLDYAADKRAPTPTGAAEMAVPVKAELAAAIAALYARLGQANRRLLQQNRQNLSALARALPAPDRLLAEPRRRFDDHAARHGRALSQLLQHKRSFFAGLKRQISPYLVRRPLLEKQQQYRHLALRLGSSFAHNSLRHAQRLETLAKLIKTLSLTSILERGFALIMDKEGKPVRRAQAVMPGQELSLHFADGIVTAAAIKSREQETAPPQVDKIARRKEKPKKDRQKQTIGQGDLF